MTVSAALMSSENTEWHTPANVLDLVRELGGGRIALDPCTSADNPCGAERFFTVTDDGLSRPWECAPGLIYANPPYGRAIEPWAFRFAEFEDVGVLHELVALVPARTDTGWWHACAPAAHAVCFWRGRLTFVGAPNAAPFPSALLYYGARPEEFARVFGPHGWVVRR